MAGNPEKSTQITHTGSGTQWGAEGAGVYGSTRHGPDGDVFLDPVFLPHINNLNGQIVIDVGAGFGPWTVYAAQHGADRVLALDYQTAMVEGIKQSVIKARVQDRVFIYQADGARLPHAGEVADIAISINVGCNLPTAGFIPHFTELFHTLRPNGKAVVTLPTSFEEVFTTGRKPKTQILKDIESRLTTIEDPKNPIQVRAGLDSLDDVYRATFVIREGKLVLVQDLAILQEGEPIWRKLPKLTVPNFYHPSCRYKEALIKAGFTIETITSNRFNSEAELNAHNASVPEEKRLGPEYAANPPFVVYVARK